MDQQLESLYDSCRRSSELVDRFLNDKFPRGLVSATKPGYVFNGELRGQVKQKVIKSLEVLDEVLDNLTLEELAVSYNGGKDCLVMLVLLLATVFKKYSSNNTIKGKLDAIYINSEAPFPTVCDFITKSATQFHLTPITILDGLKEGFKYYLNQTPKVKAIVVGIRHSDPYGSTLKYEQLTDGDWPRFLRIHPILHWDYVHIWDFLIGCNLEYCEMYDKGYTSLGGVNNTVRNPYLKQENGEYLPAYMLKDDADNRERLGRIKK